MFQSASGQGNEQSIANHSSRPTSLQLKCVSDTISNWFENRQPQKTKIPTVANAPFIQNSNWMTSSVDRNRKFSERTFSTPAILWRGILDKKCNLIATCIPLDRIRVPLDRTFLPFDRTFIPFDRTFLPFDRTFIPLDRTFLPFDRTSIVLSLAILHWFIALYMAFHIYPYLRGNSISSDRNYRSVVVTIWSAVKRGRLNLDLVFVWRRATYDYMTYNWRQQPSS